MEDIPNMATTLSVASSGYEVSQFIDLVDRELKGSPISEDEQMYLYTYKDLWRCELINYKKKTEMQFASSRQRSHKLYQQYILHELTHAEYLDKLNQEKVWRVNAARFLLQVETKLQRMKYHDL
jgi:hypothetical protein